MSEYFIIAKKWSENRGAGLEELGLSVERILGNTEARDKPEDPSCGSDKKGLTRLVACEGPVASGTPPLLTKG